MILDVRPRRSPRFRLADLAATVSVLVVTAAIGVLAQRAVGTAEQAEPGFRLLEQRENGLTRQEFASLEHPVAEDVRQNGPPSDERAIALAGADWWGEPAFQAGQGAILDPLAAWRPHSPYRHLDIASPLVNVEEGARRTWTPPACACPTVRVWMYGGSTTFGLNQRDRYTIASELAKAAYEDGLRLEISNRGQMGHLHWLEAERFRLDLLEGPPPDVVLFYDGVNDAWATHLLSTRGTGPDLPFPLEPTLADAWDRVHGERSAPAAPPGASLRGFPAAPPPSAFEQAQTVVERWDRSRRISQIAAEQHGVVARYVWQPSRYSRDLVPEEPYGNASEENAVRLIDQVMRDSLPDDVISMVDVFDGIADPLFTDDVHHNEKGARIVAEALYAALEADLRQAAQDPGA